MNDSGQQLARRVVDAMNNVSGRHPGARAAHAKGTLCAATFTATPQAAGLTRAAHMQGGPVRAHVRFSNGGGDPGAPDGTEAQGMAVKMYLDDGSTTDVVALTLPAFMVRTPEDFLELMLARAPNPETGAPDMERIGAFLAAHPEAVPPIQHALTADPPESYLLRAYSALHTFALVDGAGHRTFVRYRFEPTDGEAAITREQALERGPDYLQRDLTARLASRSFIFTLVALVAQEGDPLADPTAQWPPERERVVLGTLEVTAPAFDREQGDDVLVFDPTRVTDGVECSEDPILRFRPFTYSESVRRRCGVRA